MHKTPIEFQNYVYREILFYNDLNVNARIYRSIEGVVPNGYPRVLLFPYITPL